MAASKGSSTEDVRWARQGEDYILDPCIEGPRREGSPISTSPAWYRRGAAAITKAEVAGSFDWLMTGRAATIGSALEKGQDPFAMLVGLHHRYDWVLDVFVYPSVDRLIEMLEDEIVRPAKAKFDKLLERRANKLRTKSV